MAKGTSWAEATLNSKNIEPVAVAIVKLRLSEFVWREAISQSVENSVKLNFFSNFLKVFWVNLKAWFYLANTAHCHLRKLWLNFSTSLSTPCTFDVPTCYGSWLLSNSSGTIWRNSSCYHTWSFHHGLIGCSHKHQVASGFFLFTI